MSRVPLIDERPSSEENPKNMVMLEAGLPGDTWRYCVERERLAERSEYFRAMLLGPLAPEPCEPPPLVKLQHVEKRAFDYVLKYLHDESIEFQSVSTARATLDAAHQYLCPELARLAVEYMETNLDSSTVLDIYQGLGLYANGPASRTRNASAPSAPPEPGDDAAEIAVACTRLLLACLSVIDEHAESVLRQERFEELSPAEVAELAHRSNLKMSRESILFSALDRWSASACRRHGLEPTPTNKRAALSDKIWYSVIYTEMNEAEFVEGPKASGILSTEEADYLIARIRGDHRRNEELACSVSCPLSRLARAQRTMSRTDEGQGCGASKPGKKERQDNRKNRRKECASQSQRTCARIGNCLVRVLACVFD